MKVYTYSEVRQRLATILEEARGDGAVRIQRRDGQSFVLRPDKSPGSPLDVKGVDLGLTADEIVEFGERDISNGTRHRGASRMLYHTPSCML